MAARRAVPPRACAAACLRAWQPLRARPRRLTPPRCPSPCQRVWRCPWGPPRAWMASSSTSRRPRAPPGSSRCASTHTRSQAQTRPPSGCGCWQRLSSLGARAMCGTAACRRARWRRCSASLRRWCTASARAPSWARARTATRAAWPRTPLRVARCCGCTTTVATSAWLTARCVRRSVPCQDSAPMACRSLGGRTTSDLRTWAHMLRRRCTTS
mmetsp:Transcript_3850/g.12019  ORF Transcript_3850/g.12019 Transcript_3850/m.12019 type:complete len:213 (-) Transcript_3850:1784-2422(-)